MEYLSPSSIGLYLSDPKEFYLNYLCPERPPREPQTAAMACGSAFDAYVKSYLHQSLIGRDPKFEFTTIFEAQVESQHRDQTLRVGEYLFKMYQVSGALSDLMMDLGGAIGQPRFEIDIKGVIEGTREPVSKTFGKSLTLLGKPDVFYINRHGAHVILDWKCNGIVGPNNTSPMSGYVRLRHPLAGPKDKIMTCHRHCIPKNYGGITINAGTTLDQLNKDWARQLSIYAWLLGVEIGGDYIAAIDQIVGDGTCRFPFTTSRGTVDVPDLRIAEHRLRVSPEWQHQMFKQIQYVWEVVHSDYVFRDLSYEESKARCNALDRIAHDFTKELTPNEKWLRSLSKRKW